jgi:hypothetical protein
MDKGPYTNNHLLRYLASLAAQDPKLPWLAQSIAFLSDRAMLGHVI